MKAMLRMLARAIGAGFLALAVWQWISFDYPDINPFKFGAIFAPGAISQVLNWLIVCVLGTIGWGFFTLGRFKLGSSPEQEKQQ